VKHLRDWELACFVAAGVLAVLSLLLLIAATACGCLVGGYSAAGGVTLAAGLAAASHARIWWNKPWS
jgi:hypothetical protein